jgi:hypothetical protein
VTEPATERMGTSAAWIETPDLSKKKKLAISSIFLSDAVAMGTQQPASNNENGAKAPLSKMIQGVRYYKGAQPALYYFRLYNLATDKPETETLMQIEILQDEKPLLTIPWQPVTARQIGKDAKGLVIAGQVEMRNIQTGIYDMRVSVKDSKMKRPIQRSVAFGVE